MKPRHTSALWTVLFVCLESVSYERSRRGNRTILRHFSASVPFAKITNIDNRHISKISRILGIIKTSIFNISRILGMMETSWSICSYLFHIMSVYVYLMCYSSLNSRALYTNDILTPACINSNALLMSLRFMLSVIYSSILSKGRWWPQGANSVNFERFVN